MEDEDDDHICLACHATIVGLDNYIIHRKTKCPGRKHKLANISIAQTSADPITSVSFRLQDSIATTSQNNVASTNTIQNPMIQNHNQQIMTVQSDIMMQQPTNTSQSPYTFVTLPDQLMKNDLSTYMNSDITQHPKQERQHVKNDLSSYMHSNITPSKQERSMMKNDLSTYMDSGITQQSKQEGQLLKDNLSTYMNSNITQQSKQGNQNIDNKNCVCVVDDNFRLNSETGAVEPQIDLMTGISNVDTIAGGMLTSQSSVNTVQSDALFVNTQPTNSFSQPTNSFAQPTNSFTQPTQTDNLTTQAQHFSPSQFTLQEAEFNTPSEIAHSESHVSSHHNDDDEEQMHCGITDFLSTLELQAKTRPDKTDMAEQETFEGKLKALKIANILNDLQFSSDSEGFPSDVDDLLEYADTDDELELMDNSTRPHRIHTGGKWRPGMGPSGGMQTRGKHRPAASKIATRHGKGKGKNYTKVLQAARKSADKNKAFSSNTEEEEPLEKEGTDEPPTHGGKMKHQGLQLMETDEQEEKEIEPAEPSTETISTETKSPDRVPHKCFTCMLNFRKDYQLEKHYKSKGHKAKEKAKKKQAKAAQGVHCPICKKKSSNKYNFVRHLVSSHHGHKEQQSGESLLLDEKLQTLLLTQQPMQCRICRFFCKAANILNDHLKTDEHVRRAKALVCPQYCVRCKLVTYDSNEMLNHFESEDHLNAVSKSERPCVLKEKRNNIHCKFCKRKCYSANKLADHIKVHHVKDHEAMKKNDDRTHICNDCGGQWPSRSALKRHMNNIHTKIRMFHCKLCDRSFKDKYTLHNHNVSDKHLKAMVEQSDTRIPFLDNETDNAAEGNTCSFCEKIIKGSMKDLEEHVNYEHHFKCVQCKVQYKSKSSLKLHLSSKKHTMYSTIQKFQNDPSILSKEQTDLDNYVNSVVKDSCVEFYCKHCFVTCDSEADLRFHMLGHTVIHTEKQYQASVDGDIFLGIHERFHDLVRDIKKGRNKKFKCTDCSHELWGTNMLPHLRAHSDFFPFKCPYCVGKFTSGSALKHHLLIHLDMKLYPCKHCEKQFKRKETLKMHEVAIHKDKVQVDWKYTCEHCEEKFFRKQTLDAHVIRKHEGKQIACPFSGCRLRFRANCELKIHQRVHTGEKPYLCDFCGYAAASSTRLKRHRNTHFAQPAEKYFSCEYCQYKTQQIHHLRRHMRIHTGSKPFKCPYCKYSCNNIGNIRKHILETNLHPGKSLYPCQDCEFGAAKLKDLLDHCYNVHNNPMSHITVTSYYQLNNFYDKADDAVTLQEGQRALPCKERNIGKTKQKKKKNPIIIASDTDLSNTPFVIDPAVTTEENESVEISVQDLTNSGDEQYTLVSIDNDGQQYAVSNADYMQLQNLEASQITTGTSFIDSTSDQAMYEVQVGNVRYGLVPVKARVGIDANEEISLLQYKPIKSEVITSVGSETIIS